MLKEKEIKDNIASNVKMVDALLSEILKGGNPKELYEACRYILEAGGKRLRPYLTIKACELIGGKPEVALPYASALEMLHNFTLIHDDVMDRDELRRGKPTVHKIFGIPMAILSGDLLYTKVFKVFVDHSPEGMSSQDIVKCIQLVTNSTILLCEGQALDILYPNSVEINEKDYISMVGRKTSALFSVCAEVGAIVGGATEKDRIAIGKFAWDAGIAFQLVDDILGISADEKKLGKPIGSDIQEGKKTLIILHALKKAPLEQREKILKVLGNENASKEDLECAINILHEIGSIEYAKKTAQEYMNSSIKVLENFPDSKAKQDLVDLVKYFIERSY
jgi:geranylgeranyl diphosphate synthase type I